jgi:2-keto-4-pentenoate hydratase
MFQPWNNIMDHNTIHRIAEARFKSWKNRERFTQLLGDDKPADMTEAYAIQTSLYEIMRNEDRFTEFGGHKVALTSPAIQEMCGVSEPAYGAVFKEFIHANNHEINMDDFIRFGIEFEVCFEIGQTVPLSDKPYTKETIAPYITAAMPAFELIDDRDADYNHLDAASILTDRCWCNGIVLGNKVSDWQSLDIGNLASKVLLNGDVNDEGNTKDALGHPLNSVAFVANHLGLYGKTLKTGEVVMTGSALKTQFPVAGDTIIYAIEGLGDVKARVM